MGPSKIVPPWTNGTLQWKQTKIGLKITVSIGPNLHEEIELNSTTTDPLVLGGGGGGGGRPKGG